MKLSLRDRIIGFGMTVALIPAITLSVLLMKETQVISSHLDDELEVMAQEQFKLILNDLSTLTETTNSLLLSQVKNSLNVSRKLLNDAGGASLDQSVMVDWHATNQFTAQFRPVNIPRFLIGGEEVKRNTSYDVKTPVVDDIVELVGGTVTIFQRISEEGDMLRIATNVRRSEGTRAVDTFIPAVNPDGQRNRVISTVLSGRTYFGPAFVVNEWYLSGYEPLYNSEDEIIGVLYFGIPLDSIGSLQRAVQEMKVGQDGYVWISQGRNVTGARRLLFTGKTPPPGAQVPGDFPDTLDNVVRQALTAPAGSIHMQSYQSEGSNQHEDEIFVGTVYFEHWDWILGIVAHEKDFKAASARVHSILSNLMGNMVVGGIIALIITLLLALILGASLARPIIKTVKVAGRVADGDLRMDKEVEELNEDKTVTAEIRTLRESLYRMIIQLRSLLTKVRKSSIQVVSSSTQIRSAVRQQESTIQNFGASTSEIAAAVRQINATSQELVRTMDDVQGAASETAQKAQAGRTRLKELDHIMTSLDTSSSSVSERLAVIRNKAETIEKVVTTITKVADQTNLLSLNAAIEAEKAGEFGQGFSVVAREIRRLADQTAVATLDIEKMVTEMQNSVESGVREMNNFSGEVKRGVEHTSRINAQFSEIIEHVQQLTPRFEMVLEGMQAQSQGGDQINEAMVQLNHAAKDTASSLKEFAEAAVALQQSVDELKSEVSSFKVE